MLVATQLGRYIQCLGMLLRERDGVMMSMCLADNNAIRYSLVTFAANGSVLTDHLSQFNKVT